MQLKRLEIILSEKCNINPPCIMCGRNIHLKNNPHFYDNGFFDFALFDKFKDELKQIEHLEISAGGEPLLYPRFLDVIGLLGEKTTFSFVTNGILLTPELSEKLLHGNKAFNINISIDAATQETYKLIRQNDNFYKIISNIKAINEFKAKYNLSTNVKISMTLNIFNIDEALDFVKMGERLGCKEIRFNHFNSYPDFVPLTRPDLTYKGISCQTIPIKHDRIMDSVFEYAESKGLNVVLYGNRHLSVNPVIKPLETRKLKPNFCIQPFQSLEILQNGDVIPCCAAVHVIGNLRFNTLDEIWNNKIMQDLRSDISKGLLPRICNSDCKYIRI